MKWMITCPFEGCMIPHEFTIHEVSNDGDVVELTMSHKHSWNERHYVKRKITMNSWLTIVLIRSNAGADMSWLGMQKNFSLIRR